MKMTMILILSTMTKAMNRGGGSWVGVDVDGSISALKTFMELDLFLDMAVMFPTVPGGGGGYRYHKQNQNR